VPPCPLKISIVLSNFNYSRFLAASIDSALNQTYPNIEVIVVDDGSTDNSADILQSYSNRVSVYLRPHQGETASRNFGFSQSTGDLVCFLDADDFLAPDAAARVASAWKAAFSKLQYQMRVVDTAGKDQKLLMPRCNLDSGDVRPRLLSTGRYITAPGSGNFYSRSFLQQIVPAPTGEWPQSFDSYAATYAGFLGEIGAIQEPLAFYRVHDNNMSSAVKEQSLAADQIDRLHERQLRLRRLIQRIAKERNLPLNPGIVINHWLYLKLELAKRLKQPHFPLADRLSIWWRMAVSAITAPELTPLRRVELIAWSFASAFLPKIFSSRIIQLGFDLAPQNRLARAVRRL